MCCWTLKSFLVTLFRATIFRGRLNLPVIVINPLIADVGFTSAQKQSNVIWPAVLSAIGIKLCYPICWISGWYIIKVNLTLIYKNCLNFENWNWETMGAVTRLFVLSFHDSYLYLISCFTCIFSVLDVTAREREVERD